MISGNSRHARKKTWAIIGSALVSAICAAYLWNRHRLNDEADRIALLIGAISGARIGEVGAGKGKRAFRLANRLAPSGVLLAAEIDRRSLQALENKVRTGCSRNVTVQQASAEDCGLPKESCTGIYMRAAYHHLTRPQEMVRSLHSALQPGGVLLVIDFPPRLFLKPWTPVDVPRNRGGHGVPKQIVVHELENAGFHLIREEKNWPGSMYCLLFQKNASS